MAYYALDPGAFYERFDPWLDRFLRYIFFPFIFSAYSLVLYFWYAWHASRPRRGT